MGCRLNGLIAGVDEAGRGPIAGPVVASCVLWKACPPFLPAIKDSKLLTSKQRESLFLWIVEHALKVGIGIATPEEIDSLNILNASILSMRRAVRAIRLEPDLLIIDGRDRTNLFAQEKSVVKGDRKCFFVASASIVAKVVRDRIMAYYHFVYPCYNFGQHKGYKTALHMEALKKFGPSPIHRKSFNLS